MVEADDDRYLRMTVGGEPVVGMSRGVPRERVPGMRADQADYLPWTMLVDLGQGAWAKLVRERRVDLARERHGRAGVELPGYRRHADVFAHCSHLRGAANRDTGRTRALRAREHLLHGGQCIVNVRKLLMAIDAAAQFDLALVARGAPDDDAHRAAYQIGLGELDPR